MNDQSSIAASGLELLRKPFPANQISKLPKPTKRQTDMVKQDFKQGIRCQVCGAWHHKDVVHLDYVGHAALTDRLLDCDPTWNWEPVAVDQHGAPALDANGGMWIKLTVCGVTRYGYGHPDGKKGGDAVKETIGDALRNAAMRFGAALDLWHKGDLHALDDADSPTGEAPPARQESGPSREAIEAATGSLESAETLDALKAIWTGLPKGVQSSPAVIKAKDAAKARLDAATPPEAATLSDDHIPY